MRGVVFGALLGGLMAATLVSRTQWLNLAQVGWWLKPVLSAGAAGALVGAMRRDDRRRAAIGGAIAALLALWVVYTIVRLSMPVLFVGRSYARTVAADLARLFLYAAPAGALGALAVWEARARWARRRRGVS